MAVYKLDQQAWGTPAISNGGIFIHTVDNLYCIDADR
ncbi:PQQ-binding-like beta-propeller repeat protein [Gimesia chilikensis]